MVLHFGSLISIEEVREGANSALIIIINEINVNKRAIEIYLQFS
jgi:hypothetical protein